MPINAAVNFGKNKDQSLNENYCAYSFIDEAFIQDYTMTEMIENCLKYIDEFNKGADKAYAIEEARLAMQAFFPKMKRWSKE